MKSPAVGRSGNDNGNMELLKKSMPEMQQAIGNETGKGSSKIGVTSWSAVHETCFIRRNRNLGFDTETTLW